MYQPLTLDTTTLETYLTTYHQFLDLPVKDVTAENLLVRCLADNGYSVQWECGSHKPGSDIFILGDRRIGKSVKSAKLPQNGINLSISSFRTTKWKTLAEKIAGIRKIEEEIDGYVVFARTEWTNKAENHKVIEYDVCDIDSALLAIDGFDIVEIGNGNFQGRNDIGVKIDIVNNMSAQVWYTVPLAEARQRQLIRTISKFGPYNIKMWS